MEWSWFTLLPETTRNPDKYLKQCFLRRWTSDNEWRWRQTRWEVWCKWVPRPWCQRRSLGRALQGLQVEEIELRVWRDRSVSVPRAEDQRRKLWMPAKCCLMQACEENCLRPVKELSGRVRRISAQQSSWARNSAWHSHEAGNSACLHLPVWKTSYFKRNWTEYSERSCPSRGIVALDYMLLWSYLTILKINIQKDLFWVI